MNYKQTLCIISCVFIDLHCSALHGGVAAGSRHARKRNVAAKTKAVSHSSSAKSGQFNRLELSSGDDEARSPYEWKNNGYKKAEKPKKNKSICPPCSVL